MLAGRLPPDCFLMEVRMPQTPLARIATAYFLFGFSNRFSQRTSVLRTRCRR